MEREFNGWYEQGGITVSFKGKIILDQFNNFTGEFSEESEWKGGEITKGRLRENEISFTKIYPQEELCPVCFHLRKKLDGFTGLWLALAVDEGDETIVVGRGKAEIVFV